MRQDELQGAAEQTRSLKVSIRKHFQFSVLQCNQLILVFFRTKLIFYVNVLPNLKTPNRLSTVCVARWKKAQNSQYIQQNLELEEVPFDYFAVIN